MICPNCEYEYIDGITTCADCGAALIEKDDYEGNLVHHKDWVIVFTSGQYYEAEMVKANLEGADIESLILRQDDRSYPAVGNLQVVKLLVHKNDAEEASEIVLDIMNRKEEGTDEEE